MNPFTKALNNAAGGAKKALTTAGNAIADHLPAFGSVTVDNEKDPTSALNMARRKAASRGIGKAFQTKKPI